MERSDRYGPALPPGMVVGGERDSISGSKTKKILGPALPPGMQKSSDDDLSDEGPLTVKMDPELSQEEIDDDDDDNDDETVGPLPSEMSAGGAGQVSEEFEQRAKRMKDQLTTVKAEAEEGPSKREEWMTELPPDMSKNFGLQARQFSKGAGGPEDNDRSSWTEIQGVKKEKDMKGKKRKREEDKIVSARDQQLQQQVDDYNKSKRPDSLMDMHTKKQKKKKVPSIENSPKNAAIDTPLPQKKKEKSSVDDMLRILKDIQAQRADNRHLSFFNGIMPSLNKLNEDKILEFQGEVISLLQRLTKEQQDQSEQEQPEQEQPAQEQLEQEQKVYIDMDFSMFEVDSPTPSTNNNDSNDG